MEVSVKLEILMTIISHLKILEQVMLFLWWHEVSQD